MTISNLLRQVSTNFFEILKTYDHEGDIGYFGVFDLSFNKASDQLIYYKNEL